MISKFFICCFLDVGEENEIKTDGTEKMMTVFIYEINSFVVGPISRLDAALFTFTFVT